MNNKEFKVDMKDVSEEDMIKYQKQSELIYKINHTLPMTEEYSNLLKELFENKIGIIVE